MILYTVGCDHPGCDDQGPDAETAHDARKRAVAAGWQRWPRPGGNETLDLCPDHHQESSP